MACVNHADRDSTARCMTCGAELCDECRTEVDGKNYCAKDAPPPAVPPPPAPAAPPPSPMAAPAAGGDDVSQEQPVMAALAYIHVALVGIIIAVVILCTDMKKSRYMRFHAFHSLFLLLAVVVVSIGLGIVTGIVGAIPVIGFLAAIFGIILSMLWPLGILILEIVLAVKAYNRQELELPVITKMARDQADKMRV